MAYYNSLVREEHVIIVMGRRNRGEYREFAATVCDGIDVAMILVTTDDCRR